MIKTVSGNFFSTRPKLILLLGLVLVSIFVSALIKVEIPIVQAEKSLDQTCVLKFDDTVWCKDNESAFGYEVDTTFRQVDGLKFVTQIASGLGHFCALTSDRSVWCFGANEYGQLGSGGKRSSVNPEIQSVALEPVREIGADDVLSCAITKFDYLWCWGGGHRTPVQMTREGLPVRVYRMNVIDETVCATLLPNLEYVCWNEHDDGLQIDEFKEGEQESISLGKIGILNLAYQWTASQIKTGWGRSSNTLGEILQPQTCVPQSISFKIPESDLTKNGLGSKAQCTANMPEGHGTEGSIRSPRDCSNSHCGDVEYLDENDNVTRSQQDYCTVFAECVNGTWEARGFTW